MWQAFCTWSKSTVLVLGTLQTKIWLLWAGSAAWFFVGSGCAGAPYHPSRCFRAESGPHYRPSALESLRKGCPQAWLYRMCCFRKRLKGSSSTDFRGWSREPGCLYFQGFPDALGSHRWEGYHVHFQGQTFPELISPPSSLVLLCSKSEWW
jgi:hypothetical protein